MKSKIFFLLGLAAISLTVSGCNGFSRASSPDGGIYKSADAGKSFSQKIKIDEKLGIGNSNVLTIEFDPSNYNTLYLGTSDAGILRSTDAGETWVKDVNNFKLVTSIAIDPNAPQTIYIAAIKGGRGKILKTVNGGQDWTEALTQREDGPNFIALALDKAEPRILYAGDSKGTIYKTEDGGETWRTLYWEKSAVRDISIDNGNTSVVYFGTSGSGALVTQDEGRTLSRVLNKDGVLNIEAHPTKTGVVYLSDRMGIHKSSDFGATWQTIGTLLKPEELSARAIAVDPNDDNVMYFASGRAFYKSTNGGDTWSTVQFTMDRTINVLKINPADTNVIYAGFNTPSRSVSLFPFL